MTVSALMSGKGNDVISASPGNTLSEICDILTRHRIGAVVILDEAGALAGIVSERDIVRTVSGSGPDSLSKAVRDCMTQKVVTCSRGDTIASVMGRMTEGRFRHMPIAEGGKIVGVISIGDVVKYRIAQAEREAEEMRTYITS